MQMNREECAARIYPRLQQLGGLNDAHQFERLCLAYGRARIDPDLLPATGPVGAGGDRGRDFESFSGSGIVGVCTIQKEGLAAKIRSDIETGTGRGAPVHKVYVFLAESLPSARRMDLREKLEAEFGIEIHILDGRALAEALAEPDLLWIPEQFLAIPLLREKAGERQPRLLGAASTIDPSLSVGAVPRHLASPFHVDRDIDHELQGACDRALRQGGVSLLIAEGEPCSGRTHALLTSLARAAPRVMVHQAGTAAELQTWLGREHTAPAALLLDPLDRVLEDGGAALLRGERGSDRWRPPLLLLGAGSPSAFPEENAVQVPADYRVEVDAILMPHELARARDQLAHAGIEDEVERWGLGPTLVAAPAVAATYRRAGGAAGEAGAGRRLIEIVIGWIQAGFGEGLEERTLRELFGAMAPNDSWDQAAAWALADVAAGRAPAFVNEGRWKVHPTLRVLSLPRGWQEHWLRDPSWTALRTWAGADPGRLASLGSAVWRLGSHRTAKAVLSEAVEKGSRMAHLNLALLQLQVDPGNSRVARESLLELRDELRPVAAEDTGARRGLALTLRTLGRLDHERAPTAAADAYREAVLYGDLESMVNLAQLERYGGRPKESLCLLRKAAAEGSVLAAASLFLDFELELEAAVENLDAASLELLGALLLRQQHRDEAQRVFSLAAVAGRLGARAQLGGLLLEQDAGAAIEVLEPAVERGSRAATHYLARALADRDPPRARRLMRRAYELGSVAAGEELLAMLLLDHSAAMRAEAEALRAELGLS